MCFNIITDATCDAPLDVLQQVNIIPMYIIHSSQRYKVDANFNRLTDFYENPELNKLWKNKELKTSQPSIKDVIDIIKSCKYEKSIILTVSSKVSGTYNVVCSAKKLLEREGYHIEVIDSKTGSVGLGILVNEAIKLKQEGLDMLEVKKCIDNLKKNIEMYTLHLDIEYLLKSGRLSLKKYIFLKVLNRLPAIKIENGELRFYKLFNTPDRFISQFPSNSWIAATPKFLKDKYILASPILAVNAGEFVSIAFISND